MDCKLPPKVSTNEETIDELTKNLEKSCIQKEHSSEDEKYFDVYGKNDTLKEEKEFTSENNESTKINSDENEDEYFVDEVALKDRDVDLTEEQKQELKDESENLKNKGNSSFRNGDYVNATSVYTEGLRTCPLIFEKERAVLYANRAAARAKFMKDKHLAILDCTKAIELDSNYVKAYLRRAYLYKETDKLDEALADYKKVLTFDPNHSESICAIQILEPMINERNEKLKAEMFGKLKDLGNIILKPFGLSTNNFQMEKDEKTGGYSVKFNQNPT